MQAYSNPKRESDPNALPDVEVSADGRTVRVPRRKASNTPYATAVRFFVDGGYRVFAARKAARAWLAAKARVLAVAPEMRVTWEDEDHPWDGDCEAPALHVQALVWSTPEGYVRGKSLCLASLGGIGLNAWTDGYVREVETELLNEACDTIEAERAARAAKVPCPTCRK